MQRVLSTQPTGAKAPESEDDMSENTNTMHICDRCGEEHEDLCTVNNGGTHEDWCDDCIEKALSEGILHRCEHCGGYSTRVWDVVVRTQSWCESEVVEHWCSSCVADDATACDCCGRLHETSVLDECRTWQGDWINLCGPCYDDYYYTCNDCGDVVHSDDREWGSDDEAYCPDCIGRHRHGDNLHGYGHTYGSWFWLDDGSRKAWYDLTEEQQKAIYLGIELETDQNDDANELADDIADAYDNTMVVCKEDGSLNDEGVEIVSQPMTPKYHLEGGMWERIADIVLDHGGRSHDAGTCGLHIHISRSFFVDDDAVYRLDRLFNRFRSQLVNFSRRAGYDLHWCRIDEEDELAEIPDVDERKKTWKDKKRRAGRYEAVNTTNGKTVEIRLWRGTLNMTTFKATVQLTTGLAIIVNTMEDRLADTLTWSAVKTLVRYALEGEGIGHAELDEYLASRNL